MIKKGCFTLFIILLSATVYSAKDKEITQMQERIKALEEKIAKLEKLVAPMSKQYSAQEKAEKVEDIYEDAFRHRNTEDGKQRLRKLIKQFPEHNLSGCALLELAEAASGGKREDYLQQAIKNHSRCHYKDGVIVGALARFLLGSYYIEEGKSKEAGTLFNEIESQYPNSITHSGALLTKIIEEKYGQIKGDKKSLMGMRTMVNLTPPYPDPLRGAGKDKISVQEAIVKLLNQAGFKYDWEKSRGNTTPICSQLIAPEIQNLRLKDALASILHPLGLTYEMHGDTLILEKK